MCFWGNPEYASTLPCIGCAPCPFPAVTGFTFSLPVHLPPHPQTYGPETGGRAARQLILTLIVTAGGEVVHKVAEEIVELQRNPGRLGFRGEWEETQEWSRPATALGTWALLPRGWKAGLEASHIPPHLDLVLLPGILHGLEDAPGAPPPHLQACHVAPVPSLDQGRRLEGCDVDGEAGV